MHGCDILSAARAQELDSFQRCHAKELHIKIACLAPGGAISCKQQLVCLKRVMTWSPAESDASPSRDMLRLQIRAWPIRRKERHQSKCTACSGKGEDKSENPSLPLHDAPPNAEACGVMRCPGLGARRLAACDARIESIYIWHITIDDFANENKRRIFLLNAPKLSGWNIWNIL